MKILNKTKYFILLGALLLLDCSIGGYIGVWREYYWSTISNRQLSLWIFYLVQFVGLALLSCLISGYSQYISNILSLSIRTTLSKKALKLQTYKSIEGGGQRIQEDCLSYPTLFISLVSGIFRSIIMILVFSCIIVSQLSWYYLLFPLLYSVLGTILAGKIAFPLINLNYLNQVFEAKFRQILTKISYIDVHSNNFKMFKTNKLLTYFQSFYNQVTIIVPHLILAPLYFTARITFGIFMQLASGIVEIINSLSYIINCFADINKFLSCRKRLKEIKVI